MFEFNCYSKRKLSEKDGWSIFNNFLSKRKTPNIPHLIVNGARQKANIFNNFFALQCSTVVNSSTLPNVS